MINPHPGIPEFDYIKPETLSEASQLLFEHTGEARPLMGGTDIFVRMRDGVWKDRYLVDVKGFDGMHDLSFNPSNGLKIGAAVNMNRVSSSPEVRKYYPVLVEAVDSVASYQLRTRATIVGNICNASPAGDSIGACLLLDGELDVHGLAGTRQVPLKDFFTGPGETVLIAGDIVTSIHFPIPPGGMAGKYIKLGRNIASDLSIVGVTVVGYPDRDIPSGYRMKLALASVAPVPLVVKNLQVFLSENSITEETLRHASRIAMEACTPIDDVRASAHYRKMMVRNLSYKALKEVWEEIKDIGG